MIYQNFILLKNSIEIKNLRTQKINLFHEFMIILYR